MLWKLLNFIFQNDFLKLGNYGAFKSPYHLFIYFNDTINHNLK
jgi:hypothetical protein